VDVYSQGLNVCTGLYYRTGISSSMDFFVQVSPCMCSDRVGSAVAIFDVFQNAISDVTFPISEMAFLIDVVQEYKIR